MDEYIRIKNKHKKHRKISIEEKKETPKQNLIFLWMIKLLVTILLTLLTLILLKQNQVYKKNFHKYVFEDHFNFTKINEMYKKTFGSSIPFSNFVKKPVTTVFNEKLVYKEVSKYLDGARLTVEEKYLVPTLQNGMVVFIGKKDGYGNTIIVEGTDGVEMWYGNINKTNLKIYDYIEKGSFLGEVSNNYLYVVFKKDGKILDYTKYVS